MVVVVVCERASLADAWLAVIGRGDVCSSAGGEMWMPWCLGRFRLIEIG